METSISEKEKVLRVIKKTKSKRKVTKVKKPVLEVDGEKSSLFAEKILGLNKTRAETAHLRETIKNTLK